MVDLEELQKKIKEKGLSLAALERRADLGNGVIGRWKNSSPNLDTLQKVADVLECDIRELIASPPVRSA